MNALYPNHRSVAAAAPRLPLGVILSLMLAGAGCSTPAGYHLVRPTAIHQAMQEIPEDQLLDVGIGVSHVPELSASAMKEQGTNEEIRRSESHFVPYHLKNTLQQSSHWGAVQVMPAQDEFVDLVVTSELVASNGDEMKLKVEAADASGRVWLSRNYYAPVTDADYAEMVEGEREAFQDLYNTVANDLSAFKQSLTPEEIARIRTVSRLKFAREFAPDAYGDYLAEEPPGMLVAQRLPADDDPLMTRIDNIRAREQMFVETLNQYYEGFYLDMWDAYESWRKYYRVEQVARREAESEGFLKTIGGILMIAAGIMLEVEDVDTGGASGILVVVGGQIMIDGFNVSEQVKIHAAAVEELAQTFANDIEPTVVELEGKQYELVGTADEQYANWKELLRRIYAEETGFPIDTPPIDSNEQVGP